MHEGIAGGKCRAQLGVLQRVFSRGEIFSLFVDQEGLASKKNDIRVAGHEFDLRPEAPVHADIVGIKSREQRRPAELEATIEQPGKVVARLPMDEYPRIACGVLGEDRGSRVGRGVVDHNQLELRERFLNHAVDCLPQEGLAVAHGHHHGDRGRLHRGESKFGAGRQEGSGRDNSEDRVSLRPSGSRSFAGSRAKASE